MTPTIRMAKENPMNVKEDEDVLPERLVRFTKAFLQMMLKQIGRHDTVRCLRWALRVMRVTTDV